MQCSMTLLVSRKHNIHSEKLVPTYDHGVHLMTTVVCLTTPQKCHKIGSDHLDLKVIMSYDYKSGKSS